MNLICSICSWSRDNFDLTNIDHFSTMLHLGYDFYAKEILYSTSKSKNLNYIKISRYYLRARK